MKKQLATLNVGKHQRKTSQTQMLGVNGPKQQDLIQVVFIDR